MSSDISNFLKKVRGSTPKREQKTFSFSPSVSIILTFVSLIKGFNLPKSIKALLGATDLFLFPCGGELEFSLETNLGWEDDLF